MTANAQYLYQLLEDGEIDEQTVNDSIEAMCVGDKLEDYCKVIRQFEADVEAYKAEKERFAAKQKAAEKAVTRLEKAVLGYMTVAGKEEERCGLFNLKVGRSKAVVITDDSKIDGKFFVQQPATINKAEIRKALLAGEQVAGAELRINERIKIK
jgi:hypothetical protein